VCVWAGVVRVVKGIGKSNGFTGARRRREALSSPAATSIGSRRSGPPEPATRGSLLPVNVLPSPASEPPAGASAQSAGAVIEFEVHYT
jgi:hypothetical protein